MQRLINFVYSKSVVRLMPNRFGTGDAPDPGVACAHIESLPTRSAVEVTRPYRSSRFSALYLAHSFSVRLVTSGEAIPNRPNDRIVARTLML